MRPACHCFLSCSCPASQCDLYLPMFLACSCPASLCDRPAGVIVANNEILRIFEKRCSHKNHCRDNPEQNVICEIFFKKWHRYVVTVVLHEEIISPSDTNLHYIRDCGEPAISLHSHTVPLVHWSTRLLPIMRYPGSIPRGVLM